MSIPLAEAIKIIVVTLLVGGLSGGLLFWAIIRFKIPEKIGEPPLVFDEPTDPPVPDR